MTRNDWLSLSDEALRRACHEDFYRASGPGGQKRNKTESAVRLRHAPTGLIVVANESRSREQNRRRALKRMREAIAYRVREPVQPVTTSSRKAGDGTLRIGAKDAGFLPVAAGVLDVVDANQGRLSEAAEAIGSSTAQLVRFLRSTHELWEAAQQLRVRHGLPPLR